MTERYLTPSTINIAADNHTSQHDLHDLLYRVVTTDYKYRINTQTAFTPAAVQLLGEMYGVLHEVGNITQQQDTEVIIWNPKIDTWYIRIFEQLNLCPTSSPLQDYKWPFILHWIYTKHKLLESLVITDRYSINVILSILHGLKQDSEPNAQRIQSLWNQFILPSLNESFCRFHYQQHYLQPVFDSYLNTCDDTSNNPRGFVQAFNEFTTSFNGLFAASVTHYKKIMRFEYLDFRTKQSYFDQWFYANIGRQAGDPSNYVVFNAFVIDCLLRNRMQVNKAKQYFIEAVLKTAGYKTDYYYDTRTVMVIIELMLKAGNDQDYHEICSICQRFNVARLFNNVQLQKRYERLMSKHIL